ncbi:MAG: MFS transporter [Psychromonas sp.]|nr:MFS transporter [Psychromonas sp.]
MIGFFSPPKHVQRLPKEKIDPVYKKHRIQVFLGIFVGYAGYYLIRKNFSLAIPYLQKEGYTTAQLGIVLSMISLAYGLSKFFMGNISDRSNARYFMAAGLLLSAAINIYIGFNAWIFQNLVMLGILMFLNGWVQGMGWPPSGRALVHWYSAKERGKYVSIWNIAHNVGGGLIGPLAILGTMIFGGWHSLFYFPAFIALIIVVFILFTVRDTPQSQGLPPIEVFKQDGEIINAEQYEKELTAKEIFFKYVLNNKYLWYIAIANAFIYFLRYGIADWAPTYLVSEKGFTHDEAAWSIFWFEYAGIPGTILCGWMSDRFFKSRRAPIGIIYLLLMLVAILVYWLNPIHDIWIYMVCLTVLGFLIYGPVMLVGLYALELVPKKAAGTAAGFTGLFGYFIGTIPANAIMGFVIEYSGWHTSFMLLVGSVFFACFFLALAWDPKVKI